MEDNKVSIDQYELGSLKELNLSLYYKDVIKAQTSEQEPEKNKKTMRIKKDKMKLSKMKLVVMLWSKNIMKMKKKNLKNQIA